MITPTTSSPIIETTSSNGNFLKTCLIVCLILLAGFTVAEARPNTMDLTCPQARALVHSHRSILLSTGRYTYDRYVVSVGYCPSGDYAKSAYVQTRDRKSCPIGYTCTMDNPWPLWDD